MPSPHRRRLGVALVVDPPLADEIDGLRRAVGDPALGRIAPHLTLVPPINVRAGDLDAAVERLQAAAAGQAGPLRLSLGPPSTFLPANPVLHLEVGGELEGLRRLRDAVFAAPLERSLSWPWVPHVTLADGADEERIEAALTALRSYAVVTDFDRLVLLEEKPGRVWVPLADAALGPAARVGTGGLPLHLVAGRLADFRLAPPPPPSSLTTEHHCVVINAYREGRPAGWARWTAAVGSGHTEIYVTEEVRGQGIGRQLRAHLESRVATLDQAV